MAQSIFHRDFPPPRKITDKLEKVAKEGPHQYSITFGARNFREALARKVSRTMGREVNPETELCVTCGGTESMMATMMTIYNLGAKAIIICNPSNPCEKVFTGEELLAIGELATKYDSFVVTDEVYEHMVCPPNIHTSVAALPGMREHTITCNSLSKTYSITGWCGITSSRGGHCGT